MTQLKSFFDIVNELSMKSDKKLPNLKVPVKGKRGVSKFMRKKVITKAKDDLNAGFKTDANRKAAFAKMNDAVHSADRKPEKYVKPDGKIGIRMVKTDKEIIKKESVGKTAGDKSYYHLQRAKELAKKDGHDYDKLPKYDRAKPHQDHYHDKAKNEQMQVYRVGHKDMSGNVHATTPEDAMRKLRKKGLKGDIKLTHRGSARSMPIRRIPRREQTEAINHSDAHRDAQTHSDGSMSVKKIPSMIKKPGDKHLHLHMKSYHKEKDGQDFAKKHGYKVKNYVKTQSGTRMDIHKEETQNEISSYRLGGYLKFAKKDKNKDRTKGMKMAVRKGLGSPGIKKPSTSESVDEAVRNLSAADQVKAALKIIRDKRFNMRSQIDKKTAIQKISKDLLKDPKVKKEMDKIYEETVDEAIKHTHAVVDPAGKVAGMSSNERDAKDIARRHKGKVIKLKKPMSPNKGDMMINRPFKEEIEVDEALTLQQRMKRGRLMKRLKARIKIGRDRARRKMANKKTLEKRSMRQARNQLAKKLTRGIPKRELTFARKQEIEKRLDKPALKARIQRIAKRIFKDVRKKEVQRKKG